MTESGSAKFYRQQAARITHLAVEINNAATRLELLGIAASFQKLAAYASANSNVAAPEGEISQSA